MTVPEWVWYALIMAAVVVSLIFIRRWSYNIRISFAYRGKTYMAHRDGHFTDGQGNRVTDPELIAKLAPAAETAKKERFRRMDAQPR
jgi:hypothetical protein